MIITLFYTVLVVGVLALCIISVLSYSKSRGSDYRSLYNTETRKRILAEHALRKISNGSGNPALEAQIALDDIESVNLKDITT